MHVGRHFETQRPVQVASRSHVGIPLATSQRREPSGAWSSIHVGIPLATSQRREPSGASSSLTRRVSMKPDALANRFVHESKNHTFTATAHQTMSHLSLVVSTDREFSEYQWRLTNCQSSWKSANPERATVLVVVERQPLFSQAS